MPSSQNSLQNALSELALLEGKIDYQEAVHEIAAKFRLSPADLHAAWRFEESYQSDFDCTHVGVVGYSILT